MKLNEQLTALFLKLGVDTTSDEVKAILGNASLASIEVSDAVSSKLAGDFFTKDSAMQNPDIRSAIRAEALNGVDAEVDALGTKFGLDDETMTAIKSEKKSGKRYALLVDKIADLKEKSTLATGKDKDALNKQIEKLNGDIVKIGKEWETKLAEVETARKTDKVSWELDGIYKGYDYALPTEKNESVQVAKSIIDSIAKEKGLRFEISDKGVQILTKEGTQYFDNNIAVTPNDFIKKSLLEKKILKVSEGNGKQPDRAQRPDNGMPKQPDNSSFGSALKSMIAELPATQS